MKTLFIPNRGRIAQLNATALAVLVLALLSMGSALVGAHYIRKRSIANHALAQGSAAMQRSDWSEAARQLRRYLAKYPEDASVLREYGQACLRVQPRTRDQVLAAAGAYRSLLRLEKQDLAAFETLTKLYTRMGDTANATQTAERWAAAAPGAMEPLLWLARSEILLRDFDSAEARLRGIVNDHPDCVDAFVLLAAVETRAGENETSLATALCWLDHAIQSSPAAAEAYLYRAELLARQSIGPDDLTRQRVRADLNAAEGAESVHHETWLGIASLWLKIGETARARDALQSAARAWIERQPDDLGDPDDWLASFTVQQIAHLTHGGDYSAAADAAGAALEQLTQPMHRLRLLPEAVRIDLALRESDRARRRLDELAALQPAQHGAFADSVSFLRAVLAATGNEAYAAISELEVLVTRNPSLLEAWRLLADSYDATDQPRRAAAALRECIRLAPQQVEPMLALLRLQIRLQNWEAARATAALAEPMARDEGEYQGLRLLAEVGALSGDPNSSDAIEQLLADALSYQHENPARIESYTIIASLQALAGRIDLAEAELNRAISACADPLPAKLELVRLRIKCGDLKSAEQAALSTCDHHAASAAAAVVLSKVQSAAGRPDAARQTLEEALVRIPATTARRELFAAMLELTESSDPHARITLLREQIATNTTDVRSRVLLLEMPGVRQDTAQAQRLVDELRRIEGDGGLTWRVQQALLWLAGQAWRDRQREIEVELRRCIETDPGGLEPVLALGGMYERSGDWAKSETLYRKALGLNGGATEIVARLVDVLDKQGKLPDARATLEQYARDTPELDDQRLRVAIRGNRFDDAIALLQRHLRQNPTDIESRARLAWCTYRHTGDADSALEVLGDARQPDSPSLARAAVRIDILHAAGRNEAAREVLDELVAARGDFSAYALRAAFLADSGDANGAESDLQRGVELGADGNGELALARFCLSQNRADDAAKVLEEGVRKYPGSEALRRFQIRVLLERNRPGDHERATVQLAELERVHSDDVELMWLRALVEVAAASRDSLARAERLLERVVQLEPHMLEAQLGLTGLALQRHDLQEARGRIERALAVIPDDLKLGLLHARVELETDPAAAMDVLQNVLRVHDKDGEARRLFLEAAAAAGTPERIAEALRAAAVWMSSSSDSAPLQAPHALLLVRLGRTDEAIAALESYCVRSATDARGPALAALAAIHRARRDFDRATTCLEQAAAAGLSGLPLLREQWLLLGQQQRFDQLDSAVSEYARTDRPDPDLLLLGATILAQQPAHADRAFEIIEGIARLAPTRSDILLEYGRLLFRRGQVARAEQLYRTLLQTEPRNAGILNNLAWLLLSSGREPARALNLADRAVALHPASPTFLDTRAGALEKLGRLPLARADYERCVALTEPRPAENAAARMKLARICAALQDWETVRTQITRIGEIDSRSGLLDDEQRRELQELVRLSPEVD